MRLADSALDYNPASIMALTQLMEAGLYLQHRQLGTDNRRCSQGGTLLLQPPALFRSQAPPRRPAARMSRRWSIAGAPTA